PHRKVCDEAIANGGDARARHVICVGVSGRCAGDGLPGHDRPRVSALGRVHHDHGRSQSSRERGPACRSERPAVRRTQPVPPGAVISALAFGGRDKSNWKADVAEDLAALRTTGDHGWAYSTLWVFRMDNERGTFTRAVLLPEVERVDREETGRTPGLLRSLF